MKKQTNRREFFQTAGLAAGMMAAAGTAPIAAAPQASPAPKTMGARFRELLQKREPFHNIAVYDVMSARLVENLAAHVVKPAVINAAQPAVFQPAVAQIRAAVTAMAIERADSTLLIAKDDQLLAHQFDWQRRAIRRQFLGQRNRLPVPAQ